MITSQSSWLEFIREALALYRAFQDKTRKVCPNKSCPLNMNTPKGTPSKKVLTQDELVRKHREQYKRNHPNG